MFLLINNSILLPVRREALNQRLIMVASSLLMIHPLFRRRSLGSQKRNRPLCRCLYINNQNDITDLLRPKEQSYMRGRTISAKIRTRSDRITQETVRSFEQTPKVDAPRGRRCRPSITDKTVEKNSDDRYHRCQYYRFNNHSSFNLLETGDAHENETIRNHN